MRDAVVIKSFHNGITLCLDEEAAFEEIIRQTAEKFRQSGHFFKDAAVALSFEGRPLTSREEMQLADTVSSNSSLQIVCLVGKDAATEKLYARALSETRRKWENDGSSGYFYRGTLRRGQILETGSSIIVLGDVEPGSSVIASGNIVVLGRLRGNAYAGGCGRSGHYITALEMTPQKLKIGDFKYKTEEKEKQSLGRLLLEKLTGEAEGPPSFHNLQPQTAYVEKNCIILKPITNESLIC